MRNLRRSISVFLVLLFLGLPASPALAGGNPGVKLTRGIVNLATGWLEIPAQAAEQKKRDDTAVWWLVHGLVRGVMIGTGRTLYGAYDIITFPIAPYDAPMMDPDTLIDPKRKPRDVDPLPPAQE